MRKFARVLGELSLEEACKWASEVLNAYKVFVERALNQNMFELVTPEALGTLKEALLAKYMAGINSGEAEKLGEMEA